ncbi:hypothetical protein BHC57_03280 [Snodgrassella alvi]|uniref:Uncharacterized protein n=1 Tax=Snodgrassella alvi TaxID=1196083 RepID=A0A2N9XD91_9NEIS|nr:hypothetical protein BHC51_09595 [Snodgrassella alvi]PIT52860.1 hypothetical protein BHC49_11295 [Snodgrassella alvi]PIT60848.1 hypothetical protein BHC57_03280 [Snodgrassella alvi]
MLTAPALSPSISLFYQLLIAYTIPIFIKNVVILIKLIYINNYNTGKKHNIVLIFISKIFLLHNHPVTLMTKYISSQLHHTAISNNEKKQHNNWFQFFIINQKLIQILINT